MTKPHPTQAIEITRFHLTQGLTIGDFIRANADVDPWLSRQPGFVSRHIAQDADGEVIDILVWQSAAQGRAAARRLMSELADSPVHDTIDQGTVSWTVAPVFHRLDARIAQAG